MADFTLSPNMSLPIPIAGQDPGPDWALNLNNSLTLIDQHNHTAGYGVPIPPAGLNINSDLPFNGNNLTLARSIRLQSQAAPIAGASDLGCLYESGVDLYYNDGSGNQIRITQSGGISGSPGSIANLTSPASASYVSANQTFVWQSAANTPANLDAGFLILRNNSANSKGLTLLPPAAMANDYSLTLPSIPGSTKIMSLDNTGGIGANIDVDNATIILSANLLQIPSNVNLTGNSVRVASHNVVASNSNATTGLNLIRLRVTSIGTVLSGEGASVSRASTGIYRITFSNAFADVPVAVATPEGNPNTTCNIANNATGFVDVHIYDGGVLADHQFDIIIIAQRQ